MVRQGGCALEAFGDQVADVGEGEEVGAHGVGDVARGGFGEVVQCHEHAEDAGAAERSTAAAVAMAEKVVLPVLGTWDARSKW